MSDTEDELQLDRILAVLENPIRRRILQKLSREMNYPLQLSKELNVSQQAIMKHLKVLEENDFVVSYDERSDKGGAPRRVYVPRKRYCVRIDIGPNTYHEELHSYREYNIKKTGPDTFAASMDTAVEIGGRVTGEMKTEVAGALPAFTDPTLENYRVRLERAINSDDGKERLSLLKDLISTLNEEIDRLEKRRRSVLALRERAYEDVNDLVSEISKDYLEREILSLFVKNQIDDIDVLSTILDTRRIYVEEVFKKIQKEFN